MSLRHAILGFLSTTPLSGYDLRKAMDASVQHFWPADQAQIYRTLTRLVAEGLVDVQDVDGDTRQRKLHSRPPLDWMNLMIGSAQSIPLRMRANLSW